MKLAFVFCKQQLRFIVIIYYLDITWADKNLFDGYCKIKAMILLDM